MLVSAGGSSRCVHTSSTSTTTAMQVLLTSSRILRRLHHRLVRIDLLRRLLQRHARGIQLRVSTLSALC